MIKTNKNPEYFLTVAAERSISRAAERLYISQSYLSQHIIRLEEDLGVQLLDRNSSPLRLTEAGRIYRDYLESNSYLYQQMRAEMDALSGSREQTLSIGCGTWRGSLLLPEVLPPLLERYPKGHVQLHEFPVSELYALAMNESVDFAVMNTLPTEVPEGLVREVIGYERILLVMSPHLPAAPAMLERKRAGLPPDLSLLKEERLILLGKNLIVGSQLDAYLELSRLVFPMSLRTTNNATLLDLAAKGLGFGFLVESGLDEALKRGLLVFDTGSPELMVPLCIIRKKNAFLSAFAQDAMEEVRSYYLRKLLDGADKI